MKISPIKLIGLVVMVFLTGTAGVFAQKKADTLRQKHNESVVIYGSSKPVTGSALKIGRQPKPPALKMSVVSLNAGFSDLRVPATIRLNLVKPASHVSVSQNSKLWNNLLTLGIGSRISPLLEYFYSGGKPKRYLLSVHLQHHSSFLNIKDYLPSPYTHSKAGVSYDKFFRYHVLSVQAAYRVNTNRYYGFNTKGDTLNYDTHDPRLKQYYQLASFGVVFSSNYRTLYKLHHRFAVNGYYLFDKHGMSETHVSFDFDLHKGFKVSDIFNHQQLGLEGGFSYYRNKITKLPVGYQSVQDDYVRVMPYFDARYGMFSFRAGAHFAWLKQNSGKLHFYPYLHVNVNVAPGVFSFFAGIQGGLQKSSLCRLSLENPFLASDQNDFRWENTKIEVYGGFRGNIARRFGFEMRAGYRSFNDMAYFNHPLRFWPLYQNGQGKYKPYKNEFVVFYANGHVFDLSGSLTYGNVPHLDIWLKGEYHSYSLDNNQKPYYKPLFDMQLGASYILSKMKPWLELSYMGKRWAAKEVSGYLFPPDPDYQLSGYFDVNLGAEYRIDKQFSAFIRVTNLLNKSYFRYDGYPVAGLEIMVGIRYRF
jgi:hypothetical protein